MSISNLYMKNQYTSRSRSYIISADIVEYDIKSAGLSISKYYNLLDNDILDELYALPKHERHVHIGKLCRDNKEYNEALKQGFINIRKEFFEANNIEDSDVLSIKKDAIFLLRRVNVTKFGDCVEFTNKNEYTSYYYINRKEFYNNSERLDVKGISDKQLELHRDYMLDFLHNIFNMLETCTNDVVIKELVGFSDAYKNKELEVGYYRELNSDSSYRLKNGNFVGIPLGITEIGDVDGINISYNYMNYIRPIIDIVM